MMTCTTPSDSDGELEERIQTFSEDHDFAFVWRIEDSKNKSLCESVNAIVPSKRIFAPLDVFQEWYRNQLVVNFKDCRFTGLVFKACFDNGDGSDAHTFEGDQDGYYETTGQLVQWSIRSYRNVTMTLTARVKKMSPAATALARSTLRRAEGRVPDLRTKLGTGGHPAARIRRQLTCRWIDCPRFGRTCWWGVKNVPQYHVPIQRAHIHAWSRRIFYGKLTPKDPGGALIQRMMRFQHAPTIANASAPPVQVHIHNYGTASNFQQTIEANGVNLNISDYGPEHGGGHALGRLRLPDSPLSAMERIEQFKTWCLVHPAWRGERSKLETIMSTLEDNGYDVEGIAYIDATEWGYCGLNEADRMRTNSSAEAWMIGQGAQRRVRSS